MKHLRNLIIGLLFTLTFPVCVQAEIIPHKIYACSVESVEQTKMEEGNVLKFKAADKYELANDISVEKDSILTVRVKEHIIPKRGKRDGYLKINVVSYTIPSEDDKEIYINDKNIQGKLKLASEIDKKSIVEQTGVYVTEVAMDMPGFSQIYAATKGMIKPNEGQSRLQSMGTNLYNSTGLQYIEKGQDLILNEDSIVEISVKSKESE